MSCPIRLEHLQQLRRDAAAVFQEALNAADPYAAMTRVLSLHHGVLGVSGRPWVALNEKERIVVVGAGKGAPEMARAMEDLLGDKISGGLVSAPYGHVVPLRRVEAAEASHPLPDASGEKAATRIKALVSDLGERDLVVSCISGGGSALLPLPAPPVTLAEKSTLTGALIGCGAEIHEINAVRKHLSLVKGGRLAEDAYPATTLNLMLSDVVGDEPDCIASGPFSADTSSFGEALGVLQRHGLWEAAPNSVKKRLRDGAEGLIPETPKPGASAFQRVSDVIIGSNIMSLIGAARKAESLGYHTMILSSSVAGDTLQAAGFHCAIAREIRRSGNPIAAPACVLSGGETVVRVAGSGLGGRNQHFCLAMTEGMAELGDAVALSAGTDGRDGPTNAAGALVDSMTGERARGMGFDPARFLATYDSHHFFEALGDLIVTGPTLTNVMDVRIMLLA